MEHLSARILEGDTIFTVMSPDTEVDDTAPDHVEGFEMVMAVVRSTHLWGGSDSILIGPDARTELAGTPVCFYYADMQNFYTSAGTPRGGIETKDSILTYKMGSLFRYKYHEFRTVSDYRKVWDSQAPDAAALVAALERGRRLKAAVLVTEDLWLVNRVAFAVEEDNGDVVLVLSACPVPEFLLTSRDHFDKLPQPDPNTGYLIPSTVTQGGISASTAGWYLGRDDTTKAYAYGTMRVFEQIDPEAG